MKIPKILKVGGRKIRVIYPHIFKDTSDIINGMFDQSRQKIFIGNIDQYAKKRHAQATAHTFIHELLHAIDFIYNHNAITRMENGERAIDQIAEGLLQVICDNKLDFRGK